MAKFIEKIRLLLSSRPKPLQTGFYVYHSPESEPLQYRLHLRIEPDGEGVLIVNASSILHLNQTAVECAFYLMKGKNVDETSTLISERFNAPLATISEDVQSFYDQLIRFIQKTDQEPITDFGFEPLIDMKGLSAPYRLDCCLTYRSDDMRPEVSELESHSELDTESWKTIIQKAYNAGIPHIVFFGGEPTLRQDLTTLLRFCEELGLVTGLISSGRLLNNEGFITDLITSGLDHLMIPLDPKDEILRQALTKILPLDLYTGVSLEVENNVDYKDLISELTQLGINAFSMMKPTLDTFAAYSRLSGIINQSGIPIITDLPKPISILETVKFPNFDLTPIEVEADYVCLVTKPDGDIFTNSTPGRRLGNLKTESWDDIWERRVQA